MNSIYSIKCNCDKKTCLIKTRKFNKFINKYKLQLNLNEDTIYKNNDSCLGRIDAFEDCDYNIFNKSNICDIIKDYIYLNESYKVVKDINKGNLEFFNKQLKQDDKLNKDYAKLRILMTKALNENNIIQEKNKKLETKLKDRNNEIKQLKSKNKKLELLISNMNFKEPEPDDYSDSDDISDDEEISDNHPTANTLIKYEKIKQYMISKQISLTKLCRINNRNTISFRKRFLKLQLDRLNIAHPEIDNPIINDDEFFEILDD